jgi:5'-nucleotidase
VGRVQVATVGIVAALSLAAVLAQPRPRLVDVHILAFNDFHGSIEPPAGLNGKIGRTDAGGVQYLAAHLARLRSANPNTLIVSAGDNIGATPLLSSMFHDEPTIEALNLAGLQLSAVGNHELDKGWGELLRMQRGGCHPVDGCQGGPAFAGARFGYLAANIVLDPRRVDASALATSGWTSASARPVPLFPPYAVRTVGGVKVGVIGLTLREVTQLVASTSVKGLSVKPEAAAANDAARGLRREGVRAIVVLIHQGAVPLAMPADIVRDTDDIDACRNVLGPILPIMKEMTDDIAVIVSGHTHRAYNCTVGKKLLTSAESYGRVITDIDLEIDRHTDTIVSKHAHNIVVSRDVPGDEREAALVAHYRPLAERVGARAVGAIATTIDRVVTRAGESALGDVVADSMLEAGQTAGVRVDLALINSGGIRTDLQRPSSAPAMGPVPVTYAEVFLVLPFGNATVVRTITGAELVRVLEQQFDHGASGQRQILQVSGGFSYTYDLSRPAGERVDRASVLLNGRVVAPTDVLRLATVDFLWSGGDGFSIVPTEGEVTSLGETLDGFIAYLGHHAPVPPGARDRIRQTP